MQDRSIAEEQRAKLLEQKESKLILLKKQQEAKEKLAAKIGVLACNVFSPSFNRSRGRMDKASALSVAVATTGTAENLCQRVQKSPFVSLPRQLGD